MRMGQFLNAMGLVFSFCLLCTPVVRAAELAPAWELNDLAGEPHRLEDWRGRTVLLKLGTTVCPDCARQLTELGKIRETLDAMGIEVLDIYLGEDRSTVKQYWRKKSAGAYRPTILYDYRGKLVRDYRVSVIPQLILVDREGLIAWKGWYTGGPELVEALQRHIVADPGAAQR